MGSGVFTKRLSKALYNVGELKGIDRIHEEYGPLVQSEYVDDYLVVLYLAKMLEDGDLELKFKVSKLDYFFKLLHMYDTE